MTHFLLCVCFLCATCNFSCSPKRGVADQQQDLSSKGEEKQVVKDSKDNIQGAQRDQVTALISSKLDRGWSMKRISICSDGKTKAAFFLDDQIGWIVCQTTIEDKNETKLVTTTNGGGSWTNIGLNLPADSTVSTLLFLNELDGIIVAQKDSNEIKGVSSEIRVLRTSDGGVTWTTQYSTQKAVAKRIVFGKDPRICWIAGLKGNAEYSLRLNGLILVSEDLGQTWNDVSPDLSGSDFVVDLVPTEGVSAVALSKKGEILATTDLGKKWYKLAELGNMPSPGSGSTDLARRHDGLFAVNLGSGLERPWTLISSLKDYRAVGRYFLNNFYLTDVSIPFEGDVFACGYLLEHDEKNSKVQSFAVILSSTDFANWNLLFKEKCTTGSCGLDSIIHKGSSFLVIGNESNEIILGQKQKTERRLK